jgi:hypothetical protein
MKRGGCNTAQVGTQRTGWALRGSAKPMWDLRMSAVADWISSGRVFQVVYCIGGYGDLS